MPEKSKNLRVDRLLTQRKLARNLEHAKRLIMSGKVVKPDAIIKKASEAIPVDTPLIVKESSPYVSRGGGKLASAVKQLGLVEPFSNKIVTDIGASTGGFTDYCLQNDASTVLAVDVGYGHLHWKLRNDQRVINLEKTHIRDFCADLYPKADWVLADISFNSVSRLLPWILAAGPESKCRFLLLIKPQFELSKQHVPHGGVVKDVALQRQAVNEVSGAVSAHGIEVINVVPSELKGRSGNQEFFLLGRHA